MKASFSCGNGLIALLAAALFCVLTVHQVPAADQTVTSFADTSDPGTLRSAIALANSTGGGNVSLTLAGDITTLSALDAIVSPIALLNTSGGAVWVRTVGGLATTASSLSLGGAQTLGLTASGSGTDDIVVIAGGDGLTPGDLAIGSIGANVRLEALATGDSQTAAALSGTSVVVASGLAGLLSAEARGDNGFATGIAATDASGADVSITAGLSQRVEAKAVVYNGTATGISAGDNVVVTGGIAGTVAASAGDAGNATAIYAERGDITLLGGLSGNVTGTADESGSAAGIFTNSGDISITGGLSGTVAGTAGNGGAAIGIVATSGVAITGGLSGKVSATTGAGGLAYGIGANTTVSIAGGITSTGEVAATTGDFSSVAFGIFASEAISISGGLAGKVAATAGRNGTALGLSVDSGSGFGAGTLDGGDANTPLDITGTVSARAGTLAVAVSANGPMYLHVAGTLSGVDTSGRGNGYAVRAGYFDGTDWVRGSADNTVILDTGASLVGKVDLGDGVNTLKLYGTGSADNLVVGAVTLVVGDGNPAAWTLNPLAVNTSAYGTLTVTANAALAVNENVAITGNITDNGSLTFALGADRSYGGVITGGGSVAKTGTATLTLSGNNTYAGGTTISGGTIAIASDANLGSASAALTLSGGILQTTAAVTSGRNVTLGSGGGTIAADSGTPLTLGGGVSGTGSLTKTGSGTLTLSGINTYTGGTTISGGTIAIASDASLGSVSAALTLSGGTLQTTADVTSGRNVTLGSGGGTFATDNGTTLTLTGVISGAGSLTKTGAGTLALTGENTYTGPTVIQAGTLSLAGANASTSMSIASGAILNFNPFQSVVYAGTITGAGPVTKTGAGTLTLSGTNTYTGGTTITAGTIAIAADANLGDSTGALTFGGGTLQTTAALSTSRPMTVTSGGGTLDNGGNTVSLSGSLTGSGNLTLTGSGTNILGATFAGSSYSGTATLAAGTLQLTSGANLGGTLTLNTGSTLQGVGTINNLVSSGTISPGNSIGTITVNGNFSQSASGLYRCDLTPTGSDLISVAGSASLNGSLAIQPQYTYYASGTVWTVLTAAGGVTGTYSTSVTYGDTPEHWVFVPVYTSNAVYVTLQRQSYSSSATTASTAAVGSSLDAVAYSATGPMATLITALDYSPAPLTEYSLKVLNAQVYDAFTQSAFQAGRTLTTVQRAGLHGVMDPAGKAFANARDIGPGALSTLNGFNAVENGAGLNSGDASVPLGQFGVFLKTVGLHATQQGASDQVGYNSLLGGITGGLVYRPTEHLTLGVAPGFMSQGLTLHNTGGGQGTIQDWSLALLAGYARDAWHIDAVVRGGYDAYVSQRSLPLSIGSYTAKGNWNGWTAQVAVGGGYDFTAGPVTFGPIASVEWQHLHEDSFRETGAGSLGQSLRSRDGASLNTMLGGRVSRPFETERGTITPELRAAWGAQWLGKSQRITSAFAGNPLSAYTAKTADQGYHSLLLDAGVSMKMSQSLSGSIRGGVELFRPGYASQAVSVGLKYTF